MTDSTRLDYKKIQCVHMIGALMKGMGSIFGAMQQPPDGSLLQLKTLDFDVDGPFIGTTCRSHTVHNSSTGNRFNLQLPTLILLDQVA